MNTLLHYTTRTVEELISHFQTDLNRGLSQNEVLKRQRQFGFNEIESSSVASWQILLRQVKSSFVYLLVFAALLAFTLGEAFDGGIILVFLLINTTLGFLQEYRSEQAVKLLKKFISGQAQVRRDGKDQSIEARDLVAGDLIIIEAGDVVPADVRLVSQHGLIVDESILTGESVDVSKITDAIAHVTQAYEATNCLFKGTTIKNGKAEGLVIGIGKQTQLGTVAKIVQETKRESAFEQNINKFSQFVMRLVVGTLVIIVILHVLLKPGTTTPIELVIFSIALAVGVIPEALPLVTTFSLSRGARILAKQKVIVKRLSAIEDLGSIEVLCSDKTGTLTENKLTVSQILNLDSAHDPLFFAGLTIENYRQTKALPNNAFDLAILNRISTHDKKETHDYHVLNALPFDPDRRRNSAYVADPTGKFHLIVRGAPEIIISSAKQLHKVDREKIETWIQERGKQGERCLAVAINSHIKNQEYSEEDELQNLQIIGVLSFRDPLKSTTIPAIKSAHKLNVVVKIITGDGADVAGTVGLEAGVIESFDQVITGTKLDELSTHEKHQAVDKYHVFARISPQQKFEIIKLLQEKHQVGYLGEGINDAPALKIANVGIVVKGASDIAQEAADIVLLEQNLGVIIKGIEEGRKTFSNTVKYIKATLLSNFGNFYAVALASLVIDYLPMLPAQLLLVNLLSDFPMISISTDTVEPDELRNPKSYDVKEIILIATILGLVSTFFDFVIFAVFQSQGEVSLHTNWFIGSILTELVLLYSIRTRKLFFRAQRLPSRPLILLTILAIICTITIPYTSFGQYYFQFQAPTVNQLLTLFFIVACYFTTTEAVKLLYYKYIQTRPNKVPHSLASQG